MSQLGQKVADRIYARVDFVSQPLETLIKGTIAQTFVVADAIAAVETKAIELEIDPIAATNAAFGLAEEFGESFPSASPERTLRIKGLVHELIDEEDADFETKLEAAFDAFLDFELNISKTNTEVDVIVPE